MISGATRVAGVIGEPVEHSLSPSLHNAAYKRLDLDWVYVAFGVPAGATARALDAARALRLAGLSVTMPHKAPAAAACDELTDVARTLESVNTVTPTADGRLRGDSTDGEGFLRALAAQDHDPAGVSVLLLGAGGAARAVALALGGAGAHVWVAARRPEAAAAAADLAGGETVEWDERAEAASAASLVVNATPVGMGPDGIGPDGERVLPAAALRRGQVVCDLVYHPLETPLLRDARSVRAQVVDGLGMLVHQAALQIAAWTGRDAPVAAMRAAAESQLRQRS